jgi:integrase
MPAISAMRRSSGDGSRGRKATPARDGLRHSFATAALRARVPVEVVAARLGNTPRVVQELYSHVIPADDQAAAQLVGDLCRRDVTNL